VYSIVADWQGGKLGALDVAEHHTDIAATESG